MGQIFRYKQTARFHRECKTCRFPCSGTRLPLNRSQHKSCYENRGACFHSSLKCQAPGQKSACRRYSFAIQRGAFPPAQSGIPDIQRPLPPVLWPPGSIVQLLREPEQIRRVHPDRDIFQKAPAAFQPGPAPADQEMCRKHNSR